MDNNFPVIHLGIHNITQENFYMASGGLYHDILFLDIQMPGMDGMETAKMLRQDNENMILIFVTAAEEYVFQAFEYPEKEYPAYCHLQSVHHLINISL